MSSGDIKDFLVEEYPNTRASDWKRTSKTKEGPYAIRVFVNDNAKLEVVTLDLAAGTTVIGLVAPGTDALTLGRQLAVAAQNGGVSPTPAAPPAPKATKPVIPSPAKVAAPNKKALMKKGTKWRVTQDCEIHGWIDNPAYYETMRKLDSARISGPPRHAALQDVGKSMKVLVAKLKAGTVMTVTGKLVADLDNSVWFNDGKKTEGNGHGVPFEFKLDENELLNVKVHTPAFPGHQLYLQPGEAVINGDTAQAVFGYKFIEPFVELEGEAAEQFIYLLRNKDTGLFYRMTRYEARHYVTNPEYEKWREERSKITGPHGANFNVQAGYDWEETHPAPNHGGNQFDPTMKPEDCFEWEAKPTKAKQYADIGKMKSSILTFVGYHNGLEEGAGDTWFNETIDRDDDQGFPFLEAFEGVKLEKFTKREVEVIDLQTWYNRTIRLRALTATYGSAVRALYNKLDKAGELATNQYVVLFKSGKKDQWGDRVVDIDSDTMKGIEETIVQIGLTPKAVKRAKTPGSVAFAVANLSGAMGLKMGADDIVSVIIDLNTMQELVE